MLLSYEKYNDKRLSVRGDKEYYQHILKNLGARWNSRMKGGEGWLLNIDQEKNLIILINSLKEKEDQLDKIEKNIKGEKDKKYHRENSDVEDNNESSENESSEDSEIEIIEENIIDIQELNEQELNEQELREQERKNRKKYKKLERKELERKEQSVYNSKMEFKNHITKLQSEKAEKRKTFREKLEQKKNSNPLKYYKTFSKNPNNFKEMYASSSEEYTSSSDNDSSSSGGFPSPKSPGKTNNEIELANKVKKLQRKIQDLEIQNKKLHSKCN